MSRHVGMTYISSEVAIYSEDTRPKQQMYAWVKKDMVQAGTVAT